MEATKSAVLPVTLEVTSWIIDPFLFPLTDWLSGFHWVESKSEVKEARWYGSETWAWISPEESGRECSGACNHHPLPSSRLGWAGLSADQRPVCEWFVTDLHLHQNVTPLWHCVHSTAFSMKESVCVFTFWRNSFCHHVVDSPFE